MRDLAQKQGASLDYIIQELHKLAVAQVYSKTDGKKLTGLETEVKKLTTLLADLQLKMSEVQANLNLKITEQENAARGRVIKQITTTVLTVIATLISTGLVHRLFGG